MRGGESVDGAGGGWGEVPDRWDRRSWGVRDEFDQGRGFFGVWPVQAASGRVCNRWKDRVSS
jgi:hypothetical protein